MDTVGKSTKFSISSLARYTLQTWNEWLRRKLPRVVVIGDSITQGCDWYKCFPHLAVANHGVGGDTTHDVLARLDAVYELRPQRVFVLIGVNDLNTKVPSGVTMSNYDQIARDLRVHLRDAALFLQSVLPVGARWPYASNRDIASLNAFIKDCAQRHRAVFIDLHPEFCDSSGCLQSSLTDDGLHLNERGYALWAAILRQFVDPVAPATDQVTGS